MNYDTAMRKVMIIDVLGSSENILSYFQYTYALYLPTARALFTLSFKVTAYDILLTTAFITLGRGSTSFSKLPLPPRLPIDNELSQIS